MVRIVEIIETIVALLRGDVDSFDFAPQASGDPTVVRRYYVTVPGWMLNEAVVHCNIEVPVPQFRGQNLFHLSYPEDDKFIDFFTALKKLIKKIPDGPTKNWAKSVLNQKRKEKRRRKKRNAGRY